MQITLVRTVGKRVMLRQRGRKDYALLNADRMVYISFVINAFNFLFLCVLLMLIKCLYIYIYLYIYIFYLLLSIFLEEGGGGGWGVGGLV